MSLPVVCDMHSCVGGRAECPFASVVPTLRPFQALGMYSKIDPPGLTFYWWAGLVLPRAGGCPCCVLSL